MKDGIVVFVTCRSLKEAREIALALVRGKAAACVNIFHGPVESIYLWKRKVETAKEFLLIIKTTRGKFKAVEAAVNQLHSYETPEIIALPITTGSRNYLAWLSESVGAG